MRHNYKELFLDTFMDIKDNPIILLPDLLLVISTLILTSVFLYVNGMLQGYSLNPDYIKDYIRTLIGSAPKLIRLVISFMIVLIINVAIGVSLSVQKYSMMKSISERREINLVESFREGKGYILDVIGIKMLLGLMHIVPLAAVIFLGLNDILLIIGIGIVLAIFVLLRVAFFFVYPTLMLDTKGKILRTIRECYFYFRANKKHSVICALIVFLTVFVASFMLKKLGVLISVINISAISSIYALLSTFILVLFGVWGLLFSFKSY